jgi:hypothetical protein
MRRNSQEAARLKVPISDPQSEGLLAVVVSVLNENMPETGFAERLVNALIGPPSAWPSMRWA